MLHLVVSACLLGENCKWNGGNNRDQAVLEFLERFRDRVTAHPVCPEQMGGLSTPRAAAEIRKSDGRVVSSEGNDVTEEFLRGADAAGRVAERFGCACAILKERSPSCGGKGIYDGSFSHTLTGGMGKAAGALAGRGILVYGESELSSLERDFTEFLRGR